MERLLQQIEFIRKIDALKDVIRRSYILSGHRRENSAEHSWHVSLASLLLAEHANEEIDTVKVAKMLLIHDIIEVIAGDTYIYDDAACDGQDEREIEAANEIFGLLPDDQTVEFRTLWDEFEAVETKDAKFAKAIDRLMPFLHNYGTKGVSWKEHGIHASQVRSIMSAIRPGSEVLWQYVSGLVDDAIAKGYLPE